MVAQQYLFADAISRGMMGVNLPTFLGLRQDFGGGYSSGNNSNELTAAEILDRLMGGSGGIYAKSFPEGLPQVLKSNLKRNAIPMVGAVVGIPSPSMSARNCCANPSSRRPIGCSRPLDLAG